MTQTKIVRFKTSNNHRYFFKKEDDYWNRFKFDKLAKGDRFFFIEDGKRSDIFIAVGSPYNSKYHGKVIEALPGYRMTETATLKDMRIFTKGIDGVTPIYVNFGDKTYAIKPDSVGLHGELFLTIVEEHKPEYNDSNVLDRVPKRIAVTPQELQAQGIELLDIDYLEDDKKIA